MLNQNKGCRSQKYKHKKTARLRSVGMTLCEMVTLDAILKPNYGNFLRNAHSHREAGFLFMEWLAGQTITYIYMDFICVYLRNFYGLSFAARAHARRWLANRADA